MPTSAKFERSWRRIEKRAIYLILSLFVLYEWLGVMFPSLHAHLSEAVQTAFFATLLLAVFRLFDQRLGRPAFEAHGERFHAATDAVLPLPDSAITRLDLWARTSSKYLSVLANKQTHIRHMRLLVFAAGSVTAASTPREVENQRALVQERDVALRGWLKMKERGLIEKLEIHEYSFASQIHFMVVNDDSVQFGLFQFRNSQTSTSVPRNFTAHASDGVGHEIVDDFIALFEDVFSRYSKAVSIQALESEINKP